MTGTLIFLAAALLVLIALLTALIAREMERPPQHTAGYALAKGLPTDPGDLGLEFESWWLDRPDGARLPVWEVAGPADAARREAKPLDATAVSVHGWGHSRIDMLARMSAWRGRFARSVYYDLRGHGDAEGGLAMLGCREDEDLLALLERLGNGPFVLIGYSMGAVIALAAAGRDHAAHRTIAGVFAYAPYVDFHASLRGRLKRAAQPTRPMTDLAMAWLTLRGRRPRSLSADDLLAVGCPLTVVHGGRDIVSPPQQVEWIVATLAGRSTSAPSFSDDTEQVQRIFMEGVGHELDRLSQGEAHDEAVDAFCERLDGRAHASAQSARSS